MSARGGWPGLYLAARSGCRVVLSDLPLEGLRAAASRAQEDRLAADTSGLVAAASGLPFRAGSFDAVIHSDVLC
jgi:ubiquinone/menaquinone biosynthesis C-methylase UbiE